jgi:branched-chain amino acid transport system ATP-binding protein
MLAIESLRSGYGRIEALHGVSLNVAKGEIVALVGANGAGKTTLLRAISGVQPIFGGRVLFDGKPIQRLAPHARVVRGIAQVPEGRQVFAPLSVEDNLRLGAWTQPPSGIKEDLASVFALFPMLAEMRNIPAGALSGGQQQMLAVGRALMAKPKLLLLDEPSMGLAPKLVGQILKAVAELRNTGLTVLLVEQNARAALAIADRGYVMETGRIATCGTSAELLADNRVQEAYLGV